MVDQAAHLDAVFHALADRTRRDILHRLRSGPCTVTELARPIRMSLPAVSKHLKVLERAGLLTREIDGRVHRCQIESSGLESASKWIETCRAFWQQQFRNLEAHLQSQKSKAPGRAQKKTRGKEKRS